MSQARKESALHLALLVLVEWISLAVVILNATALILSHKADSPHKGLIQIQSTPADYALLLLGSLSFISSTLFLVIHFHIYFRTMDDQQTFSPPRYLSATEVIISVLSIALWTVATSLILTHSQELQSPCKFTSSLYTKNHNDICELFDTTIMLAFAIVGGWVLVLLATLFVLIRSPIPPTTIFTIEAPPQRFSQPMLISPPENIYSSERIPSVSKSYYIGHHGNRVSPTDENRTSIIKNNVSANGSITVKQHQRRQRRDEDAGSLISSSSLRYSRPQNNINLKQEDLGTVTPSTSYYYYGSFYQPQQASLSSSSNNNTATGEESSASYYSSRPIPHNDSFTSLQRMESPSIFHYQPVPVQFDLPVIQLGRYSRLDISFLEKI